MNYYTGGQHTALKNANGEKIKKFTNGWKNGEKTGENRGKFFTNFSVIAAPVLIAVKLRSYYFSELPRTKKLLCTIKSV